LSAETSEEPNAEEEAEGSSVDAEGSENVDAEQDSEESVDASEEDSKSVSAELATILASNKDLNKQLAKVEVKLEAAEEQVSKLTAESNDKSATISSLVKIAAEATSRLHISLGKAKTDFSKLSAEDVMTAYADAQKDFEKTFPTGTQSAVNAESREDQESLQQPRNTINPVE
jgi:3-methyladenine DNA glycosylase AlkC